MKKRPFQSKFVVYVDLCSYTSPATARRCALRPARAGTQCSARLHLSLRTRARSAQTHPSHTCSREHVCDKMDPNTVQADDLCYIMFPRAGTGRPRTRPSRRAWAARGSRQGLGRPWWRWSAGWWRRGWRRWPGPGRWRLSLQSQKWTRPWLHGNQVVVAIACAFTGGDCSREVETDGGEALQRRHGCRSSQGAVPDEPGGCSTGAWGGRVSRSELPQQWGEKRE